MFEGIKEKNTRGVRYILKCREEKAVLILKIFYRVKYTILRNYLILNSTHDRHS